MLYWYSGLAIVLVPVGVAIVIVGVLQLAGILALVAQSQYGMRKLCAAAIHAAELGPVTEEAMATAYALILV